MALHGDAGKKGHSVHGMALNQAIVLLKKLFSYTVLISEHGKRFFICK